MRRTTAVVCTAAVITGLAVAGVGGPAAATGPSRATPAVTHAPASIGGRSRGQLAVSPAARAAARILRPGVLAPAARLSHTAVRPRLDGLDSGTGLLAPNRAGLVRVDVSGSASRVAAAARRAGGRSLVSASGESSVLVPKAALADLAASSGVTAVRPAELAFPEGAPANESSQGVAASEADHWQSAGDTGSVDVAVVDAGFTDEPSEVANGHLPADTTVTNENCVNGQGAADTQIDQHGTAVAEIVHQEAPGAHLHLYCIADTVGFASAEHDIVAAGYKIATSSLGFSGDSRGDGSGPPGSAALTVRAARLAGVLWIQSAGNNAENHWSGTLVDADHDGIVDLDGTYNPKRGHYEDDVSFAGKGSASNPSYSEIDLQWDQWPASDAAVRLLAFGYRCSNDFTTDDCGAKPLNPDANGNPTPIVRSHTSGEPVLSIPLYNTTRYYEFWQVVIAVPRNYATLRYDLSYEGDVAGPSYLACPTSATCGKVYRAYAGSMTEPATSPYAFAVGAADSGADDDVEAEDEIEPFSSRGPTIDARVKPDITGWDGVSSYLPEFAGGFYGTSAAAPHVAGAAALVLAAAPTLDASQVQNFLEQRANNGYTYNPPSDVYGHGLLTLGATPAQTPVTAPAGASYTALPAPVALLDTRGTLGGHHARLGAGGTVTVQLPADTPDDATAVAINLTGVGATGGSTYVSVYPGSTFTGTSNLNLNRTNSVAAVFAIVNIGPDHTITVRNSSTPIDVLVNEVGYFGTGAETGHYTSLASPQRALDTRGSIGAQPGAVTSGESDTVDVTSVGVPADATAVIANITATDIAGRGHLDVAPTCTTQTSALNYLRATRANLALVGLDGNGRFCITGGGSAADVVVDIVGYMGPDGATYVSLPNGRRIADTRTGNGSPGGVHSLTPLAQDTGTSFVGSGVGDVSFDATALVLGVVEAGTTSGGHLALYPGSSVPSDPSSSLSFARGSVVANASVVGVSGGRFGVYNRFGTTQVALDLFGYFR